MNKRRVNIISRVLHAVKLSFPNTIQFIEDCLQQERLKENISVDEVIFLFTSLKQKVSIKKYFLFSRKVKRYAKRCSMKLNSLSHDIYLRIIWI